MVSRGQGSFFQECRRRDRSYQGASLIQKIFWLRKRYYQTSINGVNRVLIKLNHSQMSCKFRCEQLAKLKLSEPLLLCVAAKKLFLAKTFPFTVPKRGVIPSTQDMMYNGTWHKRGKAGNVDPLGCSSQNVLSVLVAAVPTSALNTRFKHKKDNISAFASIYWII